MCAKRFRAMNCRFNWVEIAAHFHSRTPRQCMRQYLKLQALLNGRKVPHGLESEGSVGSARSDKAQQLPAQTPGNLDFGFDPLFH